MQVWVDGQVALSAPLEGVQSVPLEAPSRAMGQIGCDFWFSTFAEADVGFGPDFEITEAILIHFCIHSNVYVEWTYLCIY